MSCSVELSMNKSFIFSGTVCLLELMVVAFMRMLPVK